jgi:hypothetical protein
MVSKRVSELHYARQAATITPKTIAMWFPYVAGSAPDDRLDDERCTPVTTRARRRPARRTAEVRGAVGPPFTTTTRA